MKGLLDCWSCFCAIERITGNGKWLRINASAVNIWDGVFKRAILCVGQDNQTFLNDVQTLSPLRSGTIHRYRERAEIE